ncbi:MAG: nicotinamide riboside transporter PnuC [Gemmatimonadaceae bacterium]
MENWLEPAGVLTGILTVWLSTRQRISAWPVALLNAALYFVIFQRGQLYANMGLQVIYFGLSCYGWYEWKFGGAGRTELPVTRATRRHAAWLVPLGILGAVVLGFTLSRSTDAQLPWLDSAATSTSLIAQWMMTRKLLENWLVWVTVDVVYVGMFLYAGLYLTAGLYAVFFFLAATGYVQWKRTLRTA